ncbi:chloroplast LI818 protein [Scenedesmus sp. NREL 46B-D3]|nr:chloroplast LI818 protein [Scenedesmus sp. NREL 46B-D3]
MQTVLSKSATKAFAGRSAAPVRSSVAAKAAAPETATATEGMSGYEYAKTLPGISQPFPDMFDPAGFASQAKVSEIRRWRESEIVHGRVAMLAALGFIVQEQLEDIPAFLNADGHITGPAIYQFQQVEARGAVFWEPLLLAIGLAESYRVALGWATPVGNGFNSLKGADEYELGNLGFDPLNLGPKDDPAAWKEMQTKELNNGRLAMIAIAAFTVEELVSHQEIFKHLALGIEKEAILELDDVEKDLNLPVTPVPSLVLEELKN